MKKSMAKAIVGVAIIVVLIVFVVVIINKNKNNNMKPDYDYIAIIYHSEMIGMDAGTEYIYYIYESSKKNNEYSYIKLKSNITIDGSGEKDNVGSGILRVKDDLKKITKDIVNDSMKDSRTNITYTYTKGGINEECEDISELGNKIFK